jgi:serine/threonine protein kinase
LFISFSTLFLSCSSPFLFSFSYSDRAMVDYCICVPPLQKVDDNSNGGDGQTVTHCLTNAEQRAGAAATSTTPGGNGGGDDQGDNDAAGARRRRCSDASVQTLLRTYDPTGDGAPSLLALRLLRRLLAWAPADRITPSDALKHAYFRSISSGAGDADGIDNTDSAGYRCDACGGEFELPSHLHSHKCGDTHADGLITPSQRRHFARATNSVLQTSRSRRRRRRN